MDKTFECPNCGATVTAGKATTCKNCKAAFFRRESGEYEMTLLFKPTARNLVRQPRGDIGKVVR